MIKKTLYVGAFAFIIGNFNNLAGILFRSFAGLGLDRHVVLPELLYSRVIEAVERVGAQGEVVQPLDEAHQPAVASPRAAPHKKTARYGLPPARDRQRSETECPPDC